MNCGACGRVLKTGARQCVYCGAGLGPGGRVLTEPRVPASGSSTGSGGGWGRRLAIVIILLVAVGFAFSVPLFPCKTCAPGSEQNTESCLKCLGAGRLTAVRYLTGMLDEKP